MSFYSRNVDAIIERYPRFGKEILEEYLPEGLDMTVARNGEPTAKRNGRFIHSSRNPSREAVGTVAGGAPERMIGCICFGFGLGYYARAAYRTFPDVALCIVEPDVGAFLAGLDSLDLQEMLGDPRVSLLLGADPEEVLSVVSGLPPGEIHIVSPYSLVRHDEAYFADLRNRVAQLVNRRTINRNTLERFGTRWIRNLARNLPVIASACGVADIEEICTGLPALVLAAGPSLDDVLPLLPALAERAVLIAVDTSLKASLSVGVVPDILVVVDPQYWNARHLDRCDTAGTILVSESSTHPSVFSRPYRSILLCSSLFPLGAYFERFTGSFGKLGAGGSVSTTAWDLARAIGCSPMYVAGLDLGFPQGKTHFRGSTFEERAHLLSYRTSPSEHAAFLALHDAGPYPVPANDGGEILTDKRLIIYRWWFENQLRMYPELEARSLSAHGVAIEGLEYRSPETLLTLPVVRQEVNRRLARVDRKRGGLQIGAIQRALEQLTAELEGLADLAARAVEHTRALENREGTAADHLAALERIDDGIRSSAGKEIVGFLMQQVIEETASVGADRDAQSVIARSHRLYRSIEESCRFHLDRLSPAADFLHQGFATRGRHSK